MQKYTSRNAHLQPRGQEGISAPVLCKGPMEPWLLVAT